MSIAEHKTERHPDLPPPASTVGALGWAREHLFASIPNAIGTIVAILVLIYAIPLLLNWAIFDAVWTGDNRDACLASPAAACWAFVGARFDQFIYGFYEFDERWRVDAVLALLVIGIGALTTERVRSRWILAGCMAVLYLAVFAFGPRQVFGLAGIIWLLGTVWFATGRAGSKAAFGLFMLIGYPFVTWFLLTGGPLSLGEPLSRVLLVVTVAAVGASMLGVLAGQLRVRAAAALLVIYVVAGFFGLVALFSFATVLILAGLTVLAMGTEVETLRGRVIAGVVGALVVVWAVSGQDFGLVKVPTSQWGGFMLTLVIALTGIVVSLPIGVVLALGRRSNMPVVRTICVVFIEFWRGVPLITVLFMASVMLPLFLPEGVTFDQLLRALIGVALFSAAYMAEVVRGGLQALPKGQYEGAEALGLRYWQKMHLVILPQALKTVIPGIVNTFIGLFKDTTLVLIISLFDLLGVVQLGLTDPNWLAPNVPYTGYVFTALVFWVCCYGMSKYSQHIERKLHTGHKR